MPVWAPVSVGELLWLQFRARREEEDLAPMTTRDKRSKVYMSRAVVTVSGAANFQTLRVGIWRQGAKKNYNT
jgi:hypothetical protein